jgi:hypothetical protein
MVWSDVGIGAVDVMTDARTAARAARQDVKSAETE